MNIKRLERTGYDRDAFYRHPRPDYVMLAEYFLISPLDHKRMVTKRRYRMDIRRGAIGAVPVSRLMDRIEVDLWLQTLAEANGANRERMLRLRPIVEVVE